MLDEKLCKDNDPVDPLLFLVSCKFKLCLQFIIYSEDHQTIITTIKLKTNRSKNYKESIKNVNMKIQKR